MKIIKPVWLKHEGTSIFSLDIHPDGTRVATGGGDAKVKIWKFQTSFDNIEEKKEDMLLASLENHYNPVNTVRWSPDGKYLATGSDDSVVIIWMLVPGEASTAFGSKEKSVENWRPVTTLRAHTENVVDLVWSPDAAKIATCSVDNTIIIWNVLKNFDLEKRLEGHKGHVKGISWDPFNRYLASQADDQKTIIWRISDWQIEHTNTQNHEKSAGTTFFNRPSWSPDGQYLATVCAHNNQSHSSAVITRHKWNTTACHFVGHKKPIVISRFNPQIFYRPNEPEKKFSCCVCGSQDSLISFWLTDSPRPIFVTKDMFDQTINDIAWHHDGYSFMCCSADGTVAQFLFEKHEIGDKLTETEKREYFYSIYGDQSQIAPTLTIVEDPYQLALETKASEETPNVDNSNLLVQKKTEHVMVAASTKQVTTVKKNGRKRITLVPQVANESPSVNNGAIPNLNSNVPKPTNILTNQKQVLVIQENGRKRITPIWLGSLSGQIPFPDTPESVAFKSAVQEAALTEDPEMTKPMNTAESTPKFAVPEAPVRKPATNTTTAAKPKPANAKAANTTGTVSPPLTATKKPTLTGHKRKLVSPGNTGPPQKKKRREKTKSSSHRVRMLPIPDEENGQLVCELKKPAEFGQDIDMLTDENTPAILEVVVSESTPGEFTTAIKCSSDSKLLWEKRINLKATLITGNSTFCSVAFNDGSLYLYSKAGRIIIPAISLGHAICFLECNEKYLLAVTCAHNVYVWNIHTQKLIMNQCAVPFLYKGDSDTTVFSCSVTKSGSPVINLTSKQTFSYHQGMETWIKISDDDFQNSEFNNNLPSKPGILAKLQSDFKQNKFPNFSTDHNQQTLETISHLEHQMACALFVESPVEYKIWLTAYVRKLTQEAESVKIYELGNWLLGPLDKPSTVPDLDIEISGNQNDFFLEENWSPLVLNLSKRELLADLLPIISSNRSMQRIVNAFRESLSVTKEYEQEQNQIENTKVLFRNKIPGYPTICTLPSGYR